MEKKQNKGSQITGYCIPPLGGIQQRIDLPGIFQGMVPENAGVLKAGKKGVENGEVGGFFTHETGCCAHLPWGGPNEEELLSVHSVHGNEWII